MKKKLIVSLVLSLLLTATEAFAAEITIASGAGYKRPVLEITSLYQKKTGNRIAAVFGNMSQIISQVNMSGTVSVVLGDRKFFDRSGLAFVEYQPVGQGKLVFAYRKGLKPDGIEEITGKDITRIGLPDSAKAIYGEAASGFLQNSTLLKDVSEKLLKLSTVPQVSSYLISGEIDAGFINLTDAIGIKGLIGGWLPADTTLYDPVLIEAGILKGHGKNLNVQSFVAFFETEEACRILKKYGLK